MRALRCVLLAALAARASAFAMTLPRGAPALSSAARSLSPAPSLARWPAPGQLSAIRCSRPAGRSWPPVATETPTSATLTYGSIAAGFVANPVMWWSLATLKTTGCGLPAGPFGLLGALEGVSYLVVVGFVAAAIVKKVTTGSALPAGPFGLLGAAEGLSFLSCAAGLVVLGFQLADYGYLPEAVPVDGGACSE